MKKNIILLIILLTGATSVLWAASTETLTLADSLRIAEQNSPRILLAQEKVKTAQAQAGEAFATALPTIKLTGSYTKLSNQLAPYASMVTPLLSSPTVSAFIGPYGVNAINSALNADSQEAHSVGFSLNQMLWGAHILPVMAVANLAVDQAKDSLQREKQNVDLSVTKAFYDVLKANQLLVVIQSAMDQLAAHHAQVKTMLDVGMTTEATLLQVEVQEAQLQQQVLQMTSGLELATAAFNNTLGRDLDTPVDLKDQAADPVPATSWVGLLPLAQKNRADLAALRAMIDLLKTNVQVVGSAEWPALIFTGNYNWTNVNQFSFNASDVNWMWTVAASWTLFDGMNTQSKVAEAESAVAQAIRSYDLAQKGVELELKSAWLSLQLSQKSMEAASVEVALAKKNFDIAKTRFTSGAGSNVDVLDSQSRLTQATNTLVNSQYDIEIAKATLKNAMGI
jgi:outer membrane protein TolC